LTAIIKSRVKQPQALLGCKAGAQTRTHLLTRTSLSIQ